MKKFRKKLDKLKFNSRPEIMNLTRLAKAYGQKVDPLTVVAVIEKHIFKAECSFKLPTLYLIDSIIKNHPKPYKPLFARNLDNVFVHTFEQSNEEARLKMFKLRLTWTPLFTSDILNNLDLGVKKIDPAWPLLTLNQFGLLDNNLDLASIITNNDEKLEKLEEELRQLKKKKLLAYQKYE